MMRKLGDLWFRIRALFAGGAMQRDLDDEMAFHLHMEARKLEAEGHSPPEARRLAHVRFGGVDRFAEQSRQSWGVSPVADLGRDLRWAARRLSKSPAFGALGALTLALGIGGTVALFSVVHGLLIRPLPVQDEDRLVVFWSDYDWRGVEFDFVRERLEGFDGLAAFSNDGYTLRTEAGTSMVLSTVASAELFDVLGARPLLGRTFREGEDRPGAEPVTVLSHGIWQQEFGGDREIVGKRILLNGTPVAVIGVMPEGFFFPTPETRIWTPLDLDPESGGYQGNGWLVLTGRLASGTTDARLRDELARLGTALDERFDYPDRWNKARDPYVTPLREYLLGDVRPAVLLLMAAVGLLLLMACANVAALLLARTSDRVGEMSVRTALGAGRGRLARQILTESVLLGAVGGALGLALAASVFHALVASLPLAQGFEETLSLDWTTLAGALALSLVTGGLVSLAPIRALLRGDLSGASLGHRRQGGGSGLGRMQHALVVAEVLLAVVLVTGAALLIRTVDRLRALDAGIDPDGVLTVELYLGADETQPEERDRFFRTMVERVAALPGVEHAGLINRLPIRDGGYQASVLLEGRADLVGDQRPTAYWRVVTPGALEAMGVGPVQGRLPDGGDREGSLRVAFVNRSFARRFWPGEDPVGKHFTTFFGGGAAWQVAGVLPDIAIGSVRLDVPPAGYHPWDQAAKGATSAVLVARSGGDPSALAPAVRRIAREIDGRAAVAAVESMADVVDASMSESIGLRFYLTLLSGLGLVLGTVGIYGVVSYGVERRRSELGIRMALGARPLGLLGEVVRVGMVPVVVGVGGGLAAALVASASLGRFLYDVAPTDPFSLAAAALSLLAVGMIAAVIPAVRAGRTDPGAALRAE
jgi:putative ABC transport system permease protein